MAIDVTQRLLIAQMSMAEPSPETMRLLKRVWPKLDLARREELLLTIGPPASEEELDRWREDDDLHRRLLRQWRWLAGIADDLPEPWGAAYSNLSAEFEEGDPDARRRSVSFAWGTSSPMLANEIRELGPRRFADWAREWVPGTGWREPSPEGLRQEIVKAVQESPVSWIGELPELIQRLYHPVYVRGVLEGIQEATKHEDFEPDWTRVVETMTLVVSEPWRVTRLASDPFDADPDWRVCQHTVVRIIEEAVGRDTPFELSTLYQLWDVLMRLMRTRSPKSSVEGRDDLLTPAINKLSTKALQAMFGVCLSVSRRGEDLATWRTRLAEAVEEQLAVGAEETELSAAIVASLYPQFVHIMGEPTADTISNLFGNPEAGQLRVGALSTLFEWTHPITNQMLQTYRPYVEAYLRIHEGADRERAEQRAIRWLVIAYIRQIAEQDDADVLIDALAQPQRISEAAEFYGRVLREDTRLEPGDVELALRFWDSALGRPDLLQEAFLGFGWWAEASLLDDHEWLQRLSSTLQRTNGRIDWEDAVVQRLIKMRDHPDAWRALGQMVKGAKDRWSVSYWARNLLALFEDTREATGEVREERVNLAERLLEREMHDFRQYL